MVKWKCILYVHKNICHCIIYPSGIDTEASYPYDAQQHPCHYDPSKVGATDNGFTDIEQGSEDKLKAAIASVGPVSVGIDASAPSFQFYSTGK